MQSLQLRNHSAGLTAAAPLASAGVSIIVTQAGWFSGSADTTSLHRSMHSATFLTLCVDIGDGYQRSPENGSLEWVWKRFLIKLCALGLVPLMAVAAAPIMAMETRSPPLNLLGDQAERITD